MNAQIARPRGGAANIFINYRREDSSGHAGRLFDGLSEHFAGRLFMDIDTLEPGVDFVDAIEQAVGSCEVLIVVIGRDWLSIKNAAGRRRLDDPADFVRLEVESALERKIRVIPVLVQDAPMPSSDELPPSLARLARRNAIELSDARWAYDVDRLARTIQEILAEKGDCAPVNAPAAAAVMAPAGVAPAPLPLVSAAPAGTARSRVWLYSLAALVPVAALVLAFALWPRRTPGEEVVPAQTQPVVGGEVLGLASGAATESPVPSEPVGDPVRSVPNVVDQPSAREATPAVDRADGTPPREPKKVLPVAEPHRKLVPIPVVIDDEPAEPVKSPEADPPVLKPPSVATSLPQVTITSPAAGAVVGASVQVQGTATGLGGQLAFLCIRQGNDSIYPRGEFFPAEDGGWSIQLRSSKEKTFEILVVITSSEEGARMMRDQRSRDNGLPVLPAGAAIRGTAVEVKRQGKLFGILKHK